MNIGNPVIIRQYLHETKLQFRGNPVIIYLGNDDSCRHINWKLVIILGINNRNTLNWIKPQLAVHYFSKAHTWLYNKLYSRLTSILSQEHHCLFSYHRTSRHCVNKLHAVCSLSHYIAGNRFIKCLKAFSLFIVAVIGIKAYPPFY